MSSPGTSPLLLVAHPGHELLVYGWMTEMAPRVFILTDGSGREGTGRTHYSREIVTEAGATPGSIFGRHTDARIYRALLDRSYGELIDDAHEIAAAMRDDPPSYVVTDSLEGYNPVHDLCRWIASASLRIAGAGSVPRYEFSTTGVATGDGFRVDVAEPVIERKLAAAMRYEPLRREVMDKLDRFGPELLRVECFERVDDTRDATLFESAPPEYERIGAERVAAGLYRETIRFRENLLPARDALYAAAQQTK